MWPNQPKNLNNARGFSTMGRDVEISNQVIDH